MGETITLDPTTERMFVDFMCTQCSGAARPGVELRLNPVNPKHSILGDRFDKILDHVSTDPLGVKFTVRRNGRPLTFKIGVDADYSLSKNPIKVKGIKFKLEF